MANRKIALLVAQDQQIPLNPIDVTRCKSAHYVTNRHKATLFPAMQALVERYRGIIPMGICTGSPRVNAEAVLRRSLLLRGGHDRRRGAAQTQPGPSCWSPADWASHRQAVWCLKIRGSAYRQGKPPECRPVWSKRGNRSA
jgi:hypothetical protein